MSDPISVKRRKKIQEYLQIIKAVSASTDDYLYLTEYDTGRAYFTNNISFRPAGRTASNWKIG